MADQTLQGEERARFPGLFGLGLLMAIAVALVAWLLLGSEFGIPILILTALCAIATLGYRVLAGSNRGASGDADSSDNVPKQPARGDRPLGDTPEAHDEISPHDLPLDNPGRHEAERLAATEDGTTRGHTEGGAAGAGGGDADDRRPVGLDERQGANPS